MFAWKLAGFLLAWALILHQPVICGGLPCNLYQKSKILVMCGPLKSTPFFSPPVNGLCCNEVRKVPGSNMLCIAQLLTRSERNKYSVLKILGFKDACDRSRHHQGESLSNRTDRSYILQSSLYPSLII
ncbi:hypothetical protein HU200_016662 [Digitaria exilis]|uniref:Bifunctional inhibitor/plant lipid transfer protein/seed storage helical domain-containing protein n=1 Tax=Digitaria exilis TaxID=1010633 RepID=A0A835F7R4_9POAL|nr:hypothetical protein HU200_016662 [Digitaria exilis]